MQTDGGMHTLVAEGTRRNGGYSPNTGLAPPWVCELLGHRMLGGTELGSCLCSQEQSPPPRGPCGQAGARHFAKGVSFPPPNGAWWGGVLSFPLHSRS